MGRLVAPEEFWVELRAGAKVVAAARAVGVSHWIGYRWLAEAGGPDALGLERRVGRPWGGRRARRSVMCFGLRCGVARRSPWPLRQPAPYTGVSTGSNRPGVTGGCRSTR